MLETPSPIETGNPAGSTDLAAAYRFILPTFEGPLDLLLHLIRVNEVDIADIPVVEIARQYDRMIDLMQEMNLEVAGDFLVMAATLVYIKSKFLLPADQERIALGIEEDPRADLTRALIEHERFRRAADRLAEKERLAALSFTRPPDTAGDVEGYLDVTVANLVLALQRSVEAANRRQALRSTRQEMPLSVMVERILSRLAHEDFISFGTLVGNTDGEISRLEVRIVAFLAVLELVRQGKIRAFQRGPFEEMRLRGEHPS
ncbi:MAG: segregation and condensation protein A [Acidobacteriota bacterium]